MNPVVIDTNCLSQNVILSDKLMSDNDQIEALYREMYKAMVENDTATLNRVHADNLVLTHMTGMHQSKQEYIRARM